MAKPATETWKGIVSTLYVDTYADLRRYLRAKLGDSEEAEDIAQDAYLRIYNARVDDDEVRDPRGYLFATAIRLALNRLRQRKRRATAVWPHGPESLDPGLSGSGVSLDASVAAQQKLELAAAVIEALPPKCQQVFLLHRFRGLSYQQISDELGISRKTVEYHMSRALTRLTELPD